jgi:prepilin-type N-terminal cleavage/methylation domain-containing protein
MLRTLTRDSFRAPARRGLTLIEIVVVVAIIAVLTALSAAALSKVVEVQRNKTSKDRLYKLQLALDAEYERVVSQCADDQRKKRIPDGVMKYAEGDEYRAQAIWTALQLRRQFPTNFFEAINGVTVRDRNTGQTLYTLQPHDVFAKFNSGTRDANGAWIPNTGGQPNEESGVLLYLILTDKSVGGGGAMGRSGDELTQAQQRTVGPGFQTFSDAWENSIGFHRWYAGAEVQNQEWAGSVNTFNSANLDPLDKRNLIIGWSPDPNDPRRVAMASILQFTGQNRVATVYSIGKDQVQGTGDDMFGFRLRRFDTLSGSAK